MILTDRDLAERYATDGIWGKATLDALLSRTAAARPDDVALIDAGHRDGWERPFPRELTWSALDARVSALAAVLLDAGLKQDEIVAVQLANTSESVIACLAVLRAGLIPAQMPALWRRRELAAACRRIGPAALLTASRIGPVAHGELLRDVAAGSMSVRHVFAFGADVPDGLQPLDPVMTEGSPVEGGQGLPRAGNAADHVAIVTFDTDPARPLARSHNQWLSASTVAVLASRVAEDSVLAVTLPATSLPGVACGLGTWLLTGCRLLLAMPGDPGSMMRDLSADGATHAVVPGRLAGEIARDGLGTRMLRVWRDLPEHGEPVDLPTGVDLVSYGELALRAIDEGDRYDVPVAAADPQASKTSVSRLFAARMQGVMQRAGNSIAPGALLRGALYVGGPQLPGAPLPAAGDAQPEADSAEKDGFRPTGLRCRLTTARPPVARLVGHVAETFVRGGLAVRSGEVDELYAGFPGASDAAAIAVPDEVFGHRLLAAVVAAPGGDCTLDAFRAYLDGLGVAPHLFPQDVVAVRSIPRGSDGAVLRSAMETGNAA